MILSTRKGLIVFERNQYGKWKHSHTSFLGFPVSYAFVNEIDGKWWACLDHGHWGCKLHVSTDEGTSWTEVAAPTYPEGEEIKDGLPASLKYMWVMTHGGSDKPKTLFIGTEPGGLFRSEDSGSSFELMSGLWNHPSRKKHWFGGGRDHPGIHSILVDPRNNDHIYIGISCAGVFETHDGGKQWEARNKGLRADFLPDPNSDIGQDPHLVVACKSNPDVMWQQNHCGIFKTINGGADWIDVSEQGGPANFGFAIAVDDHDPNRAWIVPAVSDEIRVAVDQALCVCRTDDGGKTWQAFRNGLPQEQCYDIVYRHSLDRDEDTMAFGTTTGNLYYSDADGENWNILNSNLPMVYALKLVSI
jgi:hypothetical protein